MSESSENLAVPEWTRKKFRAVWKWLCPVWKWLQAKLISQEALVSIGVSGLLTVYIMHLHRTLGLPISLRLQELIESGDLNLVEDWLIVSGAEIMVAVVSIALLVGAPLASKLELLARIKHALFPLVIIFFALLSLAVMTTITCEGKIEPLFIAGTLTLLFYIAWYCINRIRAVHIWIKDGSIEGKIDIAKLSFVWAIVAFVLIWVLN